jgi:hypothetical protein
MHVYARCLWSVYCTVGAGCVYSIVWCDGMYIMGHVYVCSVYVLSVWYGECMCVYMLVYT